MAQTRRSMSVKGRCGAASSVAKRIAEELKTPLGEVVGFKVRKSAGVEHGDRDFFNVDVVTPLEAKDVLLVSDL